MARPRTIDPFLSDQNSETNSTRDNAATSDISCLPLPCEHIPSSATSLRDCAFQQIQSLVARSTTCEVMPEEEDALDDGFVLCDLSVVRRKLRAWRRMFPRIKPFFALKCNPDVMVAAVLGQQREEVGFDCASISEIRLALQCTNNDARRCIYANPQRAEADLDAALSLGVEALTFDGEEELHKVSKAYSKKCKEWQRRNEDPESMPEPPEMIIRILVPDDTSSVPLGEKFGAPPSKIEALTEKAIDLGLPVIGVSFHCGSGCHDPAAYGTAIRLAKEAIDVINNVVERRARGGSGENTLKPCSLLDIGGGYPGLDGAGADVGRFGCAESNDSVEGNSGANEGDETASKIAAVVSPLVDELFPENTCPIQIISEPGRYFVEAAFALCSRVYSTGVDEDGRRHYYIAQGVQGVFKDVLLCGETFTPIALQVGETADEVTSDPTDRDSRLGSMASNDGSILFPSTVRGPSGEDFDVVCHNCFLPKLQVGDWLIFDRMGAYTISIAARSGRLPVRYVVSGLDRNTKR